MSELFHSIDWNSLDYLSMFNLVQYMMIKDIKDQDKWEHIVSTVVNGSEVVPLYYYKPFKMSKYFIREHHPDWNLNDYEDKMFYSERYF